MVVGWTDPEGARSWLGALLLAYCDLNGRLVYAGRVGAGLDHAELGLLGVACSRSSVPGCHSIRLPSVEPVWFTAGVDPSALGPV